jgi:hypothetical protein
MRRSLAEDPSNAISLLSCNTHTDLHFRGLCLNLGPTTVRASEEDSRDWRILSSETESFDWGRKEKKRRVKLRFEQATYVSRSQYDVRTRLEGSVVSIDWAEPPVKSEIAESSV